MAGEYIYNLQQLTKQYDKVTVLDQVQLAFYFGAKIGVIGGNGSGKSSLLRILAGEDKDFIGEVQIAKNIRIGYLPQEPRLDLSQTVAEAVDEGVAKARGILARYDALCDRMGEDLTDEEMDQLNHELGKVQDQIDAHDLWELDHHVELAMDALRLPPAEMPIQNISGGERRRVAMCRLLLSNPDALLLDEPTNHLDADSVQWLESYLKSFPGTVVSVTHDRYFLTNVAEWILELDRGRAFPYQGNYEAFLVQKQALQDREAKQATARKKLLDRELEWVRMNASSRHARNLARIKRYEELANQQVDTQESNLTIQIPSGARLGDLVVRARNLGKAYGDTLLMEDVTFDLPRGGIVGIIGGNGAGKTTLFKMILATELPTSGSIEVGPTVVPAHVDQLRDSLNPDHTVYEEISGGEETLDLGGKPMNSRAYCARFNFKGTDQQKKVGTLSGGERNRVHLAKLLRGGGNLLMLDEPTNDLDVETLRSLEEGLLNFGGCALVISHDRWFLDRIATHILSFEGDSKVVWFEGNYQEYRDYRIKTGGEKAMAPHRLKFRPVRHG